MVVTASKELANESANEPKDGIDLFDLLFVLTDARKRIFLFVIVAMVLGATLAGVIQMTGQAESIIRNLVNLRAEIVSPEVQFQALRTYTTEQNPEGIRAQEEINSLRDQLAKLEKDPAHRDLGRSGPLAVSQTSGRITSGNLEMSNSMNLFLSCSRNSTKPPALMKPKLRGSSRLSIESFLQTRSLDLTALL